MRVVADCENLSQANIAGLPSPAHHLISSTDNLETRRSSCIATGRDILEDQGPGEDKRVQPTPKVGLVAMSGDELSGDEALKVDQDPVITGSAAFLAGLIPKKEIGADRFLAQHPSCDGRGVTIAVFDTGIDPAAAGLQVTPDGRPKVVDVLDCTGAGDVDTSTIVKADEEGVITGASGARLQINKSWTNPSGKWRVGSKLVYELFPKALVARVQKEREKRWTVVHREATTAELRQLTAFDLKNPKLSKTSLRKERDELQIRYDLLSNLSSSYEDKGPVIDAVVWHDGEVWRVALDTQELEGDGGSGKLRDFSPLTNYRIERKYGTFSRFTDCTFVTNVYNDGNILSIVTNQCDHGTHVAGIAAGYHPEEPSLNGVAPGAQLVSCKIGESRGNEKQDTGRGLTRALMAVIENECDLINMSHGMLTNEPNYGRFVDLAEEVVNKHGVIFISSAGNNGPSLSTVIAPASSSCVVSVGAYLSPEMASQIHSVVQPPAEGLQYSFSSRGPTPDGALGVTLSAPGAAVAPVPKWTQHARDPKNGTSMSSPCACGGVALLLSSLKAEGQTISPHIVREALENTAVKITHSSDEPLTTGRGLLQLDLAHAYLQRCKERPSVLYKVRLTRNCGSGPPRRGIYLREAHDCRQASEWSVSVTPEFHEDADNTDLLVPFEERLRLQSSHPEWLKCPEYLYLASGKRTFNVVVDPTQLPEGLHYAEVVGNDLAAPWRGPSFRVPVTVTKPTELRTGYPRASFAGLPFTYGHIERRFIVVPDGATWMQLMLRVDGFSIPRQFDLSVIQLSLKEEPRPAKKNIVFMYPSSKTFFYAVRGGLTMELTLAMSWRSGIGSGEPTVVDMELEFHGIQASEENVFINGNETVTRVDVKAPLAPEWFAPSATLTRVRVAYRPVEVKLESLSAQRDKLSNGRQMNALTLTYKFSLAEGTDVTPCLSYLRMRMYDTEFESQLYMIFDANKRLLATGQTFPKAVRLSKGDYVLRLYIRHDNMSYLEKLKQFPLLLERKLDEKNKVKASFFSNIHGPITGANPLKPKHLLPGERQAVYIGVAGDDKLSNYPGVGTVLSGSLRWGDGPYTSDVRFVVPVPPKVEPKLAEKAPEEKKSISVRLEEEVRDAKVKLLSSLPLSTEEEQKEWNDLALSLKTDNPKYLPLRVKILQKLAASQVKDDKKAKVIQAANDVVSLVDKDALVKYFGVRREIDDPIATQLKKEMDSQRDTLADALYRKGLALSERDEQDVKAPPVHKVGANGAILGKKEVTSSTRGAIPGDEKAISSVLHEANCAILGGKESVSSVQHEANGVVHGEKETTASGKQEANGAILGDGKAKASVKQETDNGAIFAGETDDASSVKQEPTNGAILPEKEAESGVKHEVNGIGGGDKETTASVKQQANGVILADGEATASVKQETVNGGINGTILGDGEATASVKQETDSGAMLAEHEPPTSAKQETSNGEKEEASSVKQEATTGAILAHGEATGSVNQEADDGAINGAILGDGEATGSVKQESDVGAMLAEHEPPASAKQETSNGEKEEASSVKQEATNGAILREKEAESGVKHEANRIGGGEKETTASGKQQASGVILGDGEATASVKQETRNGAILAKQEPPTSAKHETSNGETEEASSVKQEATTGAILPEKEAESGVKHEANEIGGGEKETTASGKQQANGVNLGDGEATTSVKQETGNGAILAKQEPSTSAKHDTSNGEKEKPSSVKQEATTGAILREKAAESGVKHEANGIGGGEKETTASGKQQANGVILGDGEATASVKQETGNGDILAERETSNGEEAETSSVKQEATNAAILREKEAESGVKQEANGAAAGKEDEFEENYVELLKWVDIGALKFLMLKVKREMRAGRIGSAIKALNKLISDESKPPQKDLFELRIKLIKRAGWTHWAAYEKRWLSIRFPSAYPLF